MKNSKNRCFHSAKYTKECATATHSYTHTCAIGTRMTEAHTRHFDRLLKAKLNGTTEKIMINKYDDGIHVHGARGTQPANGGVKLIMNLLIYISSLSFAHVVGSGYKCIYVYTTNYYSQSQRLICTVYIWRHMDGRNIFLISRTDTIRTRIFFIRKPN